MTSALVALLLALLAPVVAHGRTEPYVGPSGLYTVSLPAAWTPDPVIAEDTELVLECDKPCGGFGRLTFSERPAPAGTTTADLPDIAAAHWREMQADSRWTRKLQLLGEGPAQLGGAAAYTSRIDRIVDSGYRYRHRATFALRDGMLIRIELQGLAKSWAQVQRAARPVLASLRWPTALQPMLERADALLEEGSSEAAFQLYTSRPLAGHARAQYQAGMMQASGVGTGRDFVGAVNRLDRAMQLGHLSAGIMLGVILLDVAERTNGKPPAGICDDATYALARAGHSAEAATAFLLRARQYRTGLCADKNLKWAIDYYEESVNAGSTDAAAELAAMYEAGSEVPKDAEKAAFWKDRAGRRLPR